MNGLKLLVAGLGLVIVAMLATVVVTVVHRMGGPEIGAPLSAAAPVVLAEPPGTHLAGVSPVGDRLAVLLQGGGPDRVLLLDSAGHVAARVSLAH